MNDSSCTRRALSYWPLGLALLAFMALRGAILSTAFEEVALPMFELYPMGTIAEITLRRIDFPLQYFYDNAAGQLLMGFVTAPFFALFGATYLTLKLVPATLGAVTLILVYAFLRSNFDRRAAAIGALLFAVGPTTLVKYSLVNSGNHFENLCFTMLAVCAFYRLHRAPERRTWLVVTGFAAGLAVFVFLGALLPLFLCAVLHVLVRGFRRSVRDVAWALPAFAVAILPLVLLNLDSRKGVGFLQAKFGATSAARTGDAIPRCVDFLTEHLPRASLYPAFASVSGRFADWAFLLAFAGAYVLCAGPTLASTARAVARVLARQSGETAPTSSATFQELKLFPFIACLPVTSVAYGISNLRIGGYAPPVEMGGYRYFLPHFLFAVMLIAIAASTRIACSPRQRLLGVALLALSFGAGAFNLALIDTATAERNVGRSYPGYNLAQLGRGLVAPRNAVAPAELVQHVAALPVTWRHHVITAIGFNDGVLEIEKLQQAAARAEPTKPWGVDLERLYRDRPAAWRADLARGAGIALRWSLFVAGRGLTGLESELTRVHERGLPYSVCLLEGACMMSVNLPLASKSTENLALNRTLLERAAPDLRPHIARGCGYLCGKHLTRSIARERLAVAESLAHARAVLAPEECTAFFTGLGVGLTEGIASRPKPGQWEIELTEKERLAVLEGYGAGLTHSVGAAAARIEAQAWRGRLAPDDWAALEAGLAWESYPLR